ncbi:MAG TPA: RsmE family RNA methyltransferase, partial [Phycisphaerae bacterium]
MHVPWFYCPRITGGSVELPEKEFRHAAGPLRLRKGDRVAVFDGAGNVAYGALTQITRGGARVAIEAVSGQAAATATRLILAVAMPKAQRQSFLIEKCTELGVAELWPMTCQHSVVRAAPGQNARWQRTAIEACKQCHRAHLPVVVEMRTFEEVLAHASECEQAVIAHAVASARPLLEILQELRRGASL